MTSENQNIRSNFRNQKFDSTGSLSVGKLVFLGILSIALFKFLPLTMLAPIPLILGILLFGKIKTFALVSVLSVVLWWISSHGDNANAQYALASVFGYLMTFLNAFLIGEIILRKVHPAKGLIVSGMIVVGLSAGILGTYILNSKSSIQSQIENTLKETFEMAKTKNPGVQETLNAGGEKALILKDIFSKSKEISVEIVNWLPAGIFVGVYLGLYFCLMMILRNSMLWNRNHSYPFGTKELINFQVPHNLIYFVIFGLVCLLGADHFGGEGVKTLGKNIIFCLGIFYFFQGFGVLLGFLNWIGVKGFLRSMLVVVTIWSAWKVIVVVGLFDLWVNFKKYFKNNKNKGDIQ